jgi:hypothetical protein
MNDLPPYNCLQAYCTGHAGRNEPSYGRKKRDLNETEQAENQQEATNSTEEEEQVREMIEVQLKIFTFRRG